jgi:hypothetical protein
LSRWSPPPLDLPDPELEEPEDFEPPLEDEPERAAPPELPERAPPDPLEVAGFERPDDPEEPAEVAGVDFPVELPEPGEPLATGVRLGGAAEVVDRDRVSAGGRDTDGFEDDGRS